MVLNIGDVVRLKSGGPAMTVVAAGALCEPGAVDCAWFAAGDACLRSAFPLRALERVGPEAPAAACRTRPTSRSVVDLPLTSPSQAWDARKAASDL